MALEKIISSGQAGVERAALDSAIHMLVYDWGGWFPRGKIAEDGEIPDRFFPEGSSHFNMKESDSSRPGQCMMRNIADSDATLILRFTGGGRVLSRGAKLAIKRIRTAKKYYNIADPTKSSIVPKVAKWICECKVYEGGFNGGIKHLNVLGPRESVEPGIYERSRIFMNDVLGCVSIYQQRGMRIWAPQISKSKL